MKTNEALSVAVCHKNRKFLRKFTVVNKKEQQVSFSPSSTKLQGVLNKPNSSLYEQ